MPNKLKDIFSDQMVDFNGTMHFQDGKVFNKFLDALQTVFREGKYVEGEGVSSLSMEIQDGERAYPFLNQSLITQRNVPSSAKEIPITLNTDYGEKAVLFKGYRTVHEMIMETDQNSIVYFKIVFPAESRESIFSCRLQPALAGTVRDIVAACHVAVVLMRYFFQMDGSQENAEEAVLLRRMQDKLLKAEIFFKKMYAVEQELGRSFQPAGIHQDDDMEKKVEELYLLLVEKKAVWQNARSDAGEAAGITLCPGTKKLEKGSIVSMTYAGKSEYTVCSETIPVYTANLLSNAVIKEVKEDSGGKVRVLYGETDSNPLYLSYTGFQTAGEAQKEISELMEHKKKYMDALTVSDYVKKTYSFPDRPN